MRMCITVPPKDDDGFEMTSYQHVGCFRLPRKFTTGATQLTPEDFLEDFVSDGTDDGSILPKRLQELADLISNATVAKASGSSKKKRSSASSEDSLISRLSTAYLKQSEDDDEADSRPKKKVKKEKGSKEKGPKNSDGWEEMVKIYGRYHKSKSDDLKEILR